MKKRRYRGKRVLSSLLSILLILYVLPLAGPGSEAMTDDGYFPVYVHTLPYVSSGDYDSSGGVTYTAYLAANSEYARVTTTGVVDLPGGTLSFSPAGNIRIDDATKQVSVKNEANIIVTSAPKPGYTLKNQTGDSVSKTQFDAYGIGFIPFPTPQYLLEPVRMTSGVAFDVAAGESPEVEDFSALEHILIVPKFEINEYAFSFADESFLPYINIYLNGSDTPFTGSTVHTGDTVKLSVDDTDAYSLSSVAPTYTTPQDETPTAISVTSIDAYEATFTVPGLAVGSAISCDVTLAAAAETYTVHKSRETGAPLLWTTQGSFSVTPSQDALPEGTAVTVTLELNDLCKIPSGKISYYYTDPDSHEKVTTELSLSDGKWGGTASFTMPPAEVWFDLTAAAVTPHTISTTIPTAKGTVGISPGKFASGQFADGQYREDQTITLTVTPDTDCRLAADSLTVTPATAGSQPLTLTAGAQANTWTFTMPDDDVTVAARFEPDQYAVTLPELEHAAIAASFDGTVGTSFLQGKRVKLQVTPEDGYVVDGNRLQVDGTYFSLDATGSCWFVMPGHDVTVTGTTRAAANLTLRAASTDDYTLTVTDETGAALTVLNADPGDYEVREGSKIKATVTVKDNSKAFLGWTLQEGLNTLTAVNPLWVNSTARTSPATFVVLTAKDGKLTLTANVSTGPAVTLSPGDGDGEAKTMGAPTGGSLTLPDPAELGYTAPATKLFDSWSDGSGTYAAGASYAPAADAALTALWKACDHKNGQAAVTLTHYAALAATCGQAGRREYYKCANCGSLFAKADATEPLTEDQLTIAATGNHTWNDGTVTTEPTCTTPGKKTQTCSVCHTTQEVDIAPVGSHNLSLVSAQAATSDQSGHIAYYVCSRCHKIFNDDQATIEWSVADYTTYFISIADGIASGVIALADNATEALANADVGFTVSPPTDYELDGSPTVNGNAEGVAGSGGNYSFTMPGAAAVISAAFRAITPSFSTGATLPGGTIDTAYSQQISATGGASITYSLAEGSTLPAGLSLSADGTLSGTPTTADTFSFTVQAANSAASATREFSLTVAKKSGEAISTALDAVDPTTTANNDGKITGTTTAMEYHTNATAATGWTACGEGETTGLAPGTYYVRHQATATTLPGAVSAGLVIHTMYGLTVTGGTPASGVYKQGASVTVTADDPGIGQEFTGWTATGVTLSDASAPEVTFTMPAGAVALTANYSGMSYSVAIDSDIENGTVTASPTTANYNGTITLTVTPDTGYQLVEGSLTVTGDQTDCLITPTAGAQANTWTFAMPADNVTVSAAFTALGYAINIGTFTGGSVTVEPETTATNPVTAVTGETVTLTVAPDTGYALTPNSLAVTKSGSTTVELTPDDILEYTWTFQMPPEAVTVTAGFTATNYNVSVSTEIEHGTVQADKTAANYQNEIALTVTPDDGYALTALTYSYLDESGESPETKTVDITESKKFTMPPAIVTIYAVFTAIDYSVSVGTFTGGSVEADATDEAHVSDTITLTVNADTGYQLKANSLKVTKSDNTEVTVTNNQFTMPADNVAVTAEFEKINYSLTYVTPDDPSHGQLSGAETGQMDEQITVTATPDAGYELLYLYYGFPGDDENFTSIDQTTKTFVMPASSLIVYANFTQATYNVAVASGIQHGTVSASPTTANYQGEITVTAEPATGYALTALSYTKAGGGDPVDIDQTTKKFSMPADSVTVTAAFTAIDYTVTLPADTPQGTVTASKTEKAHVSDTITLTVTPAEGCWLADDGLTVTGAASGALTLTPGTAENTWTFSMPAENVTVAATYRQLTQYNIVIPAADPDAPDPGGTIAADVEKAYPHATVTLTATAANNYKVSEITVKTQTNGTAVAVTKVSDLVYSFTMPEDDVSVTAAFTKKAAPVYYYAPAEPEEDGPARIIRQSEEIDEEGNTVLTTEWSDGKVVVSTTTPRGDKNVTVTKKGVVLIDADVPGEAALTDAQFQDIPNKWYKSPIEDLVNRGILMGSTTTYFLPTKRLSRGMMLEALYNLSGRPEYDQRYVGVFPDIEPTNYFKQPAEWGASLGIVYGTRGGFKGRDPITREQMVVLLYRYAMVLGLPSDSDADLSSFIDGDKVSGYAREAMRWAISHHLIYGRTNGRLDPLVNAKRYEAAGLLDRFILEMM